MLIAIAGNPNCGKTTLFNSLTGAHQKVGNYPGVTVEKKIGILKTAEKNFKFVDLPGTYGLSAYAEDELVARNFLLKEKIDLIINVIDSVSIERSLYLTTQLIELQIPMILVLNMIDTAKSKGVFVNREDLEKYLGMPVLTTIAHKGIGVKELVSFLGQIEHQQLTNKNKEKKSVSFGVDIDETSRMIQEELNKFPDKIGYPVFWASLRLIERDQVVWEEFKKGDHPQKEIIEKKIIKLEEHLKPTVNDSVENIISDFRYGHIYALQKKGVIKREEKERSFSEKIDLILLHRFAGPFLLLLVLWLFYLSVFKLSEIPVGYLEAFFTWLHNSVEATLPPSMIRSLIVSGAIDGVGGILGFTPLIMMMFFVISFLEDSGYMARVAFLLDRLLRFFGMHGNSILSYVVSGGIAGGCAVPGVMAARTLRDPKERLATILTAPFMNCGAKLPVFSLLIAAFFANNQGTMMFFITILSWIFALVIAGTLRKTILKGESTPFVMELPPYRLPTLKGMVIHMGERTFLYVKKAGTMILMASVIMWGLMTFPLLPEERKEGLTIEELSKEQLSYSVAGQVGALLQKVTGPLMGFDWQTNMALIGGMAAKEVVVSTLGVAYSLGEVDAEESGTLGEKLASNPDWNPTKAFSLILFVMLYMPCVSVVAVIRRETQSTKIAIFSIIYTTFVATLVATLFYQIANFLSNI